MHIRLRHNESSIPASLVDEQMRMLNERRRISMAIGHAVIAGQQVAKVPMLSHDAEQMLRNCGHQTWSSRPGVSSIGWE